MSDDDFATPYTLEERQALRMLLRDPAKVKEMFNENRETFSKGLERMKMLQKLSPDPSALDNYIIEIKTRLDLNDVIEALALNNIQFREQLKRCVDAIITNNVDKLKELRQQMDS